MRKHPWIGVCALSLLWSAEISRPQPISITTLQIFPSPSRVLTEAGQLPHWKAMEAPVQLADLKSLPPVFPFAQPIMKECGVRSLWQATYARGKTVARLELIELGDASGAFSLFSLLNRPILQTDALGDRSMVSSNDVWMWQANLVVHLFDPKPSGRSKARLLELGKEISRLIHQRSELPDLVKQLPMHNQVQGSFQYILGPQGLRTLGIPIQASTLGFDLGAEASTAKYELPEGQAQLLIISYPTPQMARKFFARAQDHAAVLQNPSAQAMIFTKRSGPLLAILLGTTDAAEANQILGTIQYSANVTWDEAPPTDAQEVRDYLRTIVRSIMLTVTLLLLTLGVGVLFGLLRLGIKLWVPFPIFDRPENIELIQLRLSEKVRPVTKEKASGSSTPDARP